MYYYYDVYLNFSSEGEVFSFYEWESSDTLEFVKKIPLYHVSSETLKDNLEYKVKYSNNLYKLLKGKAIIKDKDNIDACIFIISDKNNSLALEINEEGLVIARSKLLLEDEVNINEMIFTIKETELDYKCLEKYKENVGLRQEEKIKKTIKCEIENLKKENNKSKLKYLYYEWFNKKCDDVYLMYQDMLDDLEKNYHDNLKVIYDFIKLSYKVN